MYNRFILKLPDYISTSCQTVDKSKSVFVLETDLEESEPFQFVSRLWAQLGGAKVLGKTDRENNGPWQSDTADIWMMSPLTRSWMSQMTPVSSVVIRSHSIDWQTDDLQIAGCACDGCLERWSGSALVPRVQKIISLVEVIFDRFIFMSNGFQIFEISGQLHPRQNEFPVELRIWKSFNPPGCAALLKFEDFGWDRHAAPDGSIAGPSISGTGFVHFQRRLAETCPSQKARRANWKSMLVSPWWVLLISPKRQGQLCSASPTTISRDPDKGDKPTFMEMIWDQHLSASDVDSLRWV